MQMNVLRTKQVSHVGSSDDHGQPIAGGDDQEMPETGWQQVDSTQYTIHKYTCADI